MSKTFSLKHSSINLRISTLTRIPDYNDLFNVGAVIVTYDLASDVPHFRFPFHMYAF